ncbi:nesprin-3-like isoform X3 [Anguilla anguilla]|uniref:nesprin-3-like isoform X3 n=1 Tax=Anguilla anguilla TaxID=7936 RepID=UPI0015AF7445|nr:nesprin-3-like isoform X3 [Anguilla anguilla]
MPLSGVLENLTRRHKTRNENYDRMTQQEQETFMQCLECALSWIQAVQERLRAIDNTEGPRAALQTRLRETEVIRNSEHEGWLKVDMALVAAEVLLQTSDEEIKSQTQARVKEIKALWEETSVYITHCHSRIEWLWLHWAEYLRAQEEFERWLLRMQQALDPYVELQLGVQEKVWHLEHYRVLLDDARAQGASLERLLEEASDLHSRTKDPSVGPKAQESLREAYTQIRDKTEERVSLLQKIAEDHRVFDASIHQFWAWLDSVSVELTCYCDRQDMPESTLHPLQAKDTPENTLSSLQELCETVDREEATLQHLEGTAESVKANTSPQGADRVAWEAGRLRQAWEGLRQRLRLEEERKRAVQCARVEHSSLCEELQADVSCLLLRLHHLDQELEPEGRERAEEENEVLWRKYKDIHMAVAAEEPHVEQLKGKLTELFHISQDPMPLSDQVLAVLKQYQGLKGHAFTLLTQRETALRQLLLDPLQGFSKWSLLVTQILEASGDVTDFSHITLLVQSIKKLLKDSQQLQERLEELQVKGYLLTDMFGPQSAESLGAEISIAVQERETKHGQLLQKRTYLLDLLSRSKDFGERYESVLKWLRLLREHFISTDELKPDVPAKKALTGQFMVILKDLEEHEAHLTALQAVVPQSPADQHKLSHLCTEWKELHKAIKGRVQDSEHSTADHQYFQEKLLALEHGLLETKSRLETFCSLKGKLGVDNWQAEAERVLGELPEREMELHRVEALSQGVLIRTSVEGKGKILEDLQRLNDSWASLHTLSMDLHRFLYGDGVTSNASCITGNEGDRVGQIKTSMDLWVGDGEDVFRKSRSEQGSEGMGLEQFLKVKEQLEVGDEGGVSAGGKGKGLGWDIRAERELHIKGEEAHVGQSARGEGRFGAEDDNLGLRKSFRDKLGFSAGDDAKALGGGDEAMSLGKGVRGDRVLGTGDGGMDVEDSVRADGMFGAEAEGMDLGKGVRAEVMDLGKGVRAARVLGSGDEGMNMGKGVRADRDLGTEDGRMNMEKAVKAENIDFGKGVRAVTVLGTGDEDMDTEKGVIADRLFVTGDEGTALGKSLKADRVLGTGHKAIGLETDVRHVGGLGASNEGMNLGEDVRAQSDLFSKGEGTHVEQGVWGQLECLSGGECVSLEQSINSKSGFGAEVGCIGFGDGVRAESASAAGIGNVGLQEVIKAEAVLGDGDEGELGARMECMGLGWGLSTEDGLCAGHEGAHVRQSIRCEGRVGAWNKGVNLGKGAWNLGRLDAVDDGKCSGQGVKPEVIMEDLCGRSVSKSLELRSAARFGAEDEGSGFEKGVRTERMLGFGDEGVLPGSSEGMGLGKGVRTEGVLGFGDEGVVGASSEDMSLGKDVRAEVGLGSGDEVRVGAEDEGMVWDFRAGERFDCGPVGAHVGQSVRAERVSGAGCEGVGLSKSIQAEELCVRGGEHLTSEQAVRAEASIGSAGLSAGRHNKPGSGLDRGKRLGWSLDLGLNTVEVHAEQALRQQDASVSQVNAGVQIVDLRSIYSESPFRNHREGTEQQSGGTRIIYWGHSGKERGKAAESLLQESSGTCLYQSSLHTLEEFEAWLQAQDAKLSRIVSQKGKLTAKELRLREKELRELRSGVGWGQSFLLGLLTSQGGVGAEDPCLEELRYRWVLYKSKLQDTGDLKTHLGDQDGTVLQKEPLRNGKKSSGLLQRACCVALPLQLLLLSLLLLAFFLPLTDEGTSCSLVNNFARSFRLMLRYKGPPPT